MKKIVLLLSITLIFLSCSLSNVQKESNIIITPKFLISSRGFTVGIKNMSLTITADDLNDITFNSSSNTISVTIPKGKNRKFKLIITLEDGSVFSGSATSDIIEDIEYIDIILSGLLKKLKIVKEGNMPADIHASIIGNSIYFGLPIFEKDGVSPLSISNPNFSYIHDGASLSFSNLTLDDSLNPSVCTVTGINGEKALYNVKTFYNYEPLMLASNITTGDNPDPLGW